MKRIKEKNSHAVSSHLPLTFSMRLDNLLQLAKSVSNFNVIEITSHGAIL